MNKSMTRSNRLEKELSQLFGLEAKIDTTLSVSVYYINQFMDSERSSIWFFRDCEQQLSIYSSLDLEMNEISIPKSSGVVGWVFANRKPAVVNNAYEDDRFCKKVDDMTGFRTRNLVCTPILYCNDNCLGTLQSINKQTGDFTTKDLELLNLAAGMVAIAIGNSGRYDEVLVGDKTRKNVKK